MDRILVKLGNVEQEVRKLSRDHQQVRGGYVVLGWLLAAIVTIGNIALAILGLIF